MNKTSDMVFRLVKALKPKEAADFRRSLTVYEVAKGKNNFLTLFDALNGFDAYDEKLLRKKLPKTFKQSNLSSLKTQLKSKLMDFLIAHHTSEFQQIHRRLEEIEVLFTRGFYPETSIAIDETKEFLLKIDLKTYTFVATYFESCLLNYYLGEKNVLTALKDIAALNARIAGEISLSYRIGSYLARVFALQAKGNICRNKEDETELYALLKYLTDDLAVPNLTGNQKINIYAALVRLETLAVKHDEALAHASALHAMIFEKYDEFKASSDSERFYSLLTDALGCAIGAKRVDMAVLWFDDLEKSLKELPASSMYSEFCEIYKYQLKNLSNISSEREAAFKQLLAHYATPGFQNTAAQKEAQLAIALAYLKRKEYREADYYLYQMVESAQSTEFFIEQYDFVRVLRLVALYEQLFLPTPNKLSFESYRLQVNTVYQRIRKKTGDEDYRLEKIMLDFFRSITEQTTKNARKRLLLDTHVKLTSLFEESPLYVKQISEYFNFLNWIESKIANSEK